MADKSAYLEHGVNMMFYVEVGLATPFLGAYFLEMSDFFLTGLLTAIPLIFLTVASPIWGSLADRYGSKIILFFSFISTAMAYAFLASTSNPMIFFVLYCFFNSTMAGFTPAIQRMMSYQSQNQGKAFGSYVATASVGFLIGSFVSGLLYDAFGMQIILTLALLVCLGGAVVSVVLKEHIIIPSSQITSTLQHKSVSNASHLRILETLVLVFLVYIGTSVGSTFATIYLLNEFLFPSAIVGLANGVATAFGAVLSVIGATWFSTRVRGIFIAGVGSYALVWGTFWLVPLLFGHSVPGTGILLVVYLIPAYVGLIIAAPAIISSQTAERQRGRTLGFLSATVNLGNAAGATLGGLIAMFVPTLSVNFAVSALMLVVLTLASPVFLPRGYQSGKAAQEANLVQSEKSP